MIALAAAKPPVKKTPEVKQETSALDTLAEACVNLKDQWPGLNAQSRVNALRMLGSVFEGLQLTPQEGLQALSRLPAQPVREAAAFFEKIL